MDSFFGFLLGLVTFDWLRQRSDATAQADAITMALALHWECADCEDDVYLDGSVLRHASNRQVMRATPHGTPHAAAAYLPLVKAEAEDWDDDEVPVVDNSAWVR